MRTFAIGDIHGNTIALDALMQAMQPAPADTLVFLGDYVDRGPDSKGVIDRLIFWKQHLQLICLRGNHELMMTRGRTDAVELKQWLTAGGTQTLGSYAVNGRVSLESVPKEHWTFLDEELFDYFETERHIFAHANLEPQTPLAQQPELYLFWEFMNHGVQHDSSKTLICGHTRQNDGLPKVWPGTVCIDTGAHRDDGWLTGYCVETGHYLQANSLGQTRQGDC